MSPLTRTRLNELAGRRILILDGAMGTMIQGHGLQEADFRGELLARPSPGSQGQQRHPEPDPARRHRGHLPGLPGRRGPTSSPPTPSTARWWPRPITAPGTWCGTSTWPRPGWPARPVTSSPPPTPTGPASWRASLAPTNRTCSISPDVNDPGLRNITFNELVTAYGQEAEALLDGGADILMVETVFDPLNAKAAVFALEQVLVRRGLADFPVWIFRHHHRRQRGRTLTGQTPEAFWISLRHAAPAVFGLNCALGATAMRPYVEEISACADTLVSAHPQRRAAQRAGGLRRDSRPDGRHPGRFCRGGAAEHRRRVLRHHPRAHPGLPTRPLRGNRAPQARRPAQGHLSGRPGAPAHRRGFAVRQRGRAHQRGGQPPLRPAHPRGQAGRGPGSGPQAGARRGPDGGREHGRRHAGRGGGHGHLPEHPGQPTPRSRGCP